MGIRFIDMPDVSGYLAGKAFDWFGPADVGTLSTVEPIRDIDGATSLRFMDFQFDQMRAGVKESRESGPPYKFEPHIKGYLEDVGYFAAGLPAEDDSLVSWCGALHARAHLAGGNNPVAEPWAAENWNHFGEKLEKEVFGATAVIRTRELLPDGNYRFGSHVASIVGTTARGGLVVIGGNQSNKVNLTEIGVGDTWLNGYQLESLRYPKGVAIQEWQRDMPTFEWKASDGKSKLVPTASSTVPKPYTWDGTIYRRKWTSSER